jgi:hypothetical protein
LNTIRINTKYDEQMERYHSLISPLLGQRRHK